MGENVAAIVERFETICKKYCKNQAEFAKKTCLTQDTISRIKKGNLSLQTATKIADTFDLSLDYIYARTDIPNVSRYLLEVLTVSISADVQKAESDGKEYLLPLIKLSPFLAEYLQSLLKMSALELPEKVRKAWKEETEETLVKAIAKAENQKDKVSFLPVPAGEIKIENGKLAPSSAQLLDELHIKLDIL